MLRLWDWITRGNPGGKVLGGPPKFESPQAHFLVCGGIIALDPVRFAWLTQRTWFAGYYVCHNPASRVRKAPKYLGYKREGERDCETDSYVKPGGSYVRPSATVRWLKGSCQPSCRPCIPDEDKLPFFMKTIN